MRDEHLLKPPLIGQMQNETVKAGNVREEKPPCQTNLRRAVLKSVGKIMQDIRAIV